MTVDLAWGTVNSWADPDNKGRIQVRLLPDLLDSDESDLPWVGPWFSKSSTSEASEHQPPDVKSPVWVIFTDAYRQQGFYLNGNQNEDNFDFSKISQQLGNVTELGSQDQTTTRWTRFADGTMTFQNSKNKEFGILHSSGSYALFGGDGSLTGFSSKNVVLKNSHATLTLDNTGEVSAVGVGLKFGTSTGTEDFLVTYSKLQTVLLNIMSWVSSMMMSDPLSGVAGNVLPTMAVDVLFPTLKTVDIPAMKTGS